jgi:uncharacterized protein YukE
MKFQQQQQRMQESAAEMNIVLHDLLKNLKNRGPAGVDPSQQPAADAPVYD